MGIARKPRRAIILVSAMAIVLAFSLPKATHAKEISAIPTASPVLVDGQNIPFDAYNIEGSNYFKLRDLAFTLNGGPKSFEISFDSVTKAILLTANQPYTPVGGEMAAQNKGSVIPLPNASKVFLNGREIQLTAYNIGGNTYFKLRDMAQALDFAVEWDEESGSVLIDTGRGYGQTAEEVPLVEVPVITEDLGGQKPGAELNETPLGAPRRILNENADTQVRIYGDYSHFTLLCVNKGQVVYIYVNYDNHHKQADKLFIDYTDGGRAYAAAAGAIPVFDAPTTEQLIFEITNAFRGYHNVDALRWNDTLGQVARKHTQNMAQQNFFSHQSPDGANPGNRLSQAGYTWLTCAENIVAGQQDAFSAVDALINSAPHRKNILTTNCDEIGVGWVKGEQSTYIFYGTQLFGRK